MSHRRTQTTGAAREAYLLSLVHNGTATGVTGMQLGDLYAHGAVGLAPDRRRAVYWYERSALLGVTDAAYWAGCYMVSTSSSEKETLAGLRWLRRAERSGHAGATALLGRHYMHKGKRSTALAYLYLAARRGDASALTDLGLDAFREAPGRSNDTRALEGAAFFAAAARGRDPTGAYFFGECLRSGVGVEKDEATGMEWLKWSADAGYAKAIDEVDSFTV